MKNRIKHKLNEEGLITVRYWQALLTLIAIFVMLYLMFAAGIFVGLNAKPEKEGRAYESK